MLLLYFAAGGLLFWEYLVFFSNEVGFSIQAMSVGRPSGAMERFCRVPRTKFGPEVIVIAVL